VVAKYNKLLKVEINQGQLSQRIDKLREKIHGKPTMQVRNNQSPSGRRQKNCQKSKPESTNGHQNSPRPSKQYYTGKESEKGRWVEKWERIHSSKEPSKEGYTMMPTT